MTAALELHVVYVKPDDRVLQHDLRLSKEHLVLSFLFLSVQNNMKNVTNWKVLHLKYIIFLTFNIFSKY